MNSKELPANQLHNKKISYIIPCYNEEKNILLVYKALVDFAESTNYTYEIILVDDGSSDATAKEIHTLADNDERVIPVIFSRNFGKEAATSAGLHAATGDAAVIIDADLQHPVATISEFITKWESGAEVIIGVRKQTTADTWLLRECSKFFYKFLNTVSETHTIPQSTDFRLIDRVVIDEFNHLTEHNRITRGLIDWIGFKREVVMFDVAERAHGDASYSTWKRIMLGYNTVTSLSLFPLHFSGLIGFITIIISALLGAMLSLNHFIFRGALDFITSDWWLATGILLVGGITFSCIGLIARYIEMILKDSLDRPLYIVRKTRK